MIDGTIINEFKNLKTTFQNRIKKNSITYYDNDCYLIDNEWYNELEKNIEIYENNNNQLSNKKGIYNGRNIGNFKIRFPKKSPDFINDINGAIDYFQSNNKPQLISTKLMNKIYKKENLKNMNVVKYYSGFNNLIIMFIEKEYNSGLFLFSPLDNNNKKNIIFSFKTNNKKLDKNTQFFSELLQMKNIINITLVDNLINRKIINHYQIINKNDKISEEILKIFISIFYCEKSLSSNINEIFSNSQNFNLINPEWLINFKDFYHYEILKDLLNKYEIVKKGINYSNLSKNINEILLYLKDKINVDKIELSDELINYSLISPPILTEKNIVYNDKCHLIPFSLMNLIKENTFKNKKISIKPNMAFAKDNNVYIIDSKKIIFGNINDELLFIAKYIFSYDSKEILDEEKDSIYSTSITEYINQRNCNQDDSNFQKLRDSKSRKIGEFIILNNDAKSKDNNYVEKNDSSLINKILDIKVIENNNKYKNSKKPRFHSEFGNYKNSNLPQRKIDENDENKDKQDKLNLKNINNNIKNLNDRLKKNQQITDEYDLEVQNNLNNESLLEDLQEKIKELEKDNKDKEIELNNTIKILNEKEIIIQKMNEENGNIKKELENLNKHNNGILGENKILLNNLEKNKEEIKNKEEEISNLKSSNNNEKDKYEKLIAKMEEENNKLKEDSSKNKELLEIKGKELLKYEINIKFIKKKKRKLKNWKILKY